MRQQQRQCWALALASHLLLAAQLAAGAPSEGALPCPSADKCQFRVLAVGDSLTKGAVPSAGANHPYTIKLQQLLQQKLGPRGVATVSTAGYNFMGTFQKGVDDSNKPLDVTLVPFLRGLLATAKQQGLPYTWVVVLAGINDLGAGNRTAKAVLPKLAEAYDLALASGANVLAVSLFPNRFVARTSPNEAQRQQLNSMLRSYVARQPDCGCGKPRVYLQTLPPSWFDFWDMGADKVKQMQDDLLHLTPFGYDLLGGLIFDSISSKMPLQGCMCPV